MHPEFWHQRWQAGRTGFHRDSVHPGLVRWWPELGIAPGSRVFVPLCGKSLDLLWLSGQGFPVTGLEISPLAVEAFFAENGLEPRTAPAGRFTRWWSGDLEILCGDYFELDTSLLAPPAAVYDRAALIALPPAMRPRYAAHLARLTDRHCRLLLITLEYDPAEMDGPPYPVLHDEVRRLFGDRYRVERLADADVLDGNERFRNKGLTRLRECIYRLAPG